VCPHATGAGLVPGVAHFLGEACGAWRKQVGRIEPALQARQNPGGLACPASGGATQGPFRGLDLNRYQPVPPTPTSQLSDARLLELLSAERLSTYVARCNGDLDAALRLYAWNAAVSAGFWEPLGHLEVALRNTMSAVLAERHRRNGLVGSWLDDTDRSLDGRARADIAIARRVRRKGKRQSDSQTISELGFGFWRFLITRRHTALWPDLASAFPGAPDRRRETVEDPVARLHELRNRIAHHQRVWNRDLAAAYADVLLVAGYLDVALPAWIAQGRGIPTLLDARPRV
jgi:hypothetical protein